MNNPYIIILSLFTVAGVGTLIWGLKIMIDARQSRDWPSVKGTITTSLLNSEDDEMLPDIRFSYRMGETAYEETLKFPASTTPTRELSQQYVDRYPVGMSVDVYYNPLLPEQVTLEPGGRAGDWMVLLFGLGATALMIFAWLTHA